MNPKSLRIPVAVIAERRPGTTKWSDEVWRVVEVLEAALPVEPWTRLREEAGRTLFFAGESEVMLHPTDTSNYKHNLEAAQPLVWVVLRHAGTAAGIALHTVTVDPGEAHLHADAGNDLLEALPMPPGLREATADFVARHHVERAFHKRKRDRADPEALARRTRDEEE
ncbi:DUF3305 domain-containing protein [Falsiroseomonas sp. HW251]|uniref:DUF3305 domain-containing protein n=1 Tax=Falsiroseomonas sp. HW251 TaxID=3390998 RepID=UPI003D32026F